MDATGYVSVVATQEVYDALEDLCYADPEVCDLSYFFVDEEGNPLEGSEAVVADPVLFPDRSIIERSGVMHDSGERTDKMLEMWSRVKGDNLSPVMLIFIIVSFVILIVWGVWRKVDSYRKQQMMLKRRHHERKIK
jgi:spermidine/putrescine transport system substrate-binding protein